MATSGADAAPVTENGAADAEAAEKVVEEVAAA
jgi:hypothetical protein